MISHLETVTTLDPKSESDRRVRTTLKAIDFDWPIVLCFESLAEDAEFVGLELGSPEHPWPPLAVHDVQRVVANLPALIDYARAEILFDRGKEREALRVLNALGTTRRGLPGSFLRIIANEYEQRVRAGEAAPVTTIAGAHGVNKSTASRWVKAARARGWITEAVS